MLSVIKRAITPDKYVGKMRKFDMVELCNNMHNIDIEMIIKFQKFLHQEQVFEDITY